MTSEELYEFMRTEIEQFRGNYNSNEYSQKCKTLLKASYDLNDYPAYRSLETDWKLIEDKNPLFKEERDLNRSKSPLSSFMYNLDSGFYPPPEVLLALCSCFSTYFNANGRISLDEAFFGRKHKIKSSQAYLDSLELKYSLFHSMYAKPKRLFNSELNGKPLVDKAIEFLELPINQNHELDPESFLRGYRRWQENKHEP